MSGGDGGYVAVDIVTTPTSSTASSPARACNARSTAASTSRRSTAASTEAAGNFLFIHPFAMDPTNSNRLWYGGAFAWRSNNRGTNWTRVSNSFAARISAWAVAPSDPNRVYVGVQNLGTTTSGRVFTHRAATTLAAPVTWASAQPRQGYVSSVAVDPTIR